MVVLTEIVLIPQGKRTPLMLEVPVMKELEGPFLVTSSKSLIWVDKFPTDVVRAAVRKVPPDFMFRDMIISTRGKSEEMGWENVFPSTAEGLKSALGHLEEYELTPAQVLVGSNFDVSIFSTEPTETTWVPEGWAVIVPVDRTYLGTSFDFGDGQWAGVLHNASRGLSILTPLPAA